MQEFYDYHKIQDFMSNLGLSKEELDIYLTLLDKGKLNNTEISNTTKIPRTTANRKIKRLLGNGLISQSSKNGQKTYIAEKPEKIELMLRHKKLYYERKIQENQDSINELPHLINSIFNLIPNGSDNTEAMVKYYQGRKGYIDICNRALEFAQEEILQISNCEKWRRIFTSEYSLNNYVPRRLKKKISVRALVTNNKKGREFQKEGEKLNRETRFLSDNVDFNGSLLIYDNEVSILLPQKPYIAILLTSQEIYQIFLSLFNDLWKNSIKP
ncbi:winged helix-turn-helix transcriptional regulator [Candidatus Dojkabacteria bacterium]|nr:winged helix-turn-helix transcriptional regulator [Candidatus Dojkabacteria bacterium]